MQFNLNTDLAELDDMVESNGMNNHSEEFYIENLERLLGRPLVSSDNLGELTNSTFIGTSGSEFGYAIAIDSTGCAYITGEFSVSSFFYGSQLQGGSDVFVCKISADGTNLIYAATFGGTSDEKGVSIAVDDTGCAYITGYTSSDDYPTTAGVINTTHNGGMDVFVTKISATSSLIYSTFIGTTWDEEGRSIAVDDTGCAYITGHTLSNDFPTTAGVINTTHNGNGDVFVSKISADGTQLLYSTYLGGPSSDEGSAIAIDSTGCAYITGRTFDDTQDFPTTVGAINTTHNGNYDVFVSKISADGTQLLYSTFLGDSSSDEGSAIAVDSTGCAYITGQTYGFPTTSGAFDTTHNGNTDVFVSKINADGTQLLYSTLLGGSNYDEGHAIAIDGTGCAYITGQTGSNGFPITSGVIQNTRFNFDGFVCKISTDGTQLLYSTFLGGWDTDFGAAIAVDDTNYTYITGYTQDAVSLDFPTTSGAFDTTHNGQYDVFVSKIEIVEDLLPTASFTANVTNIIEGQSVKFTYTGNKGNEPSDLQWNFGDGTANVTVDNPTHFFAGAGSFWVNLTITDKNGDHDLVQQLIIVQTDLIPTAGFSTNSTNIEEGQSVAFTFTGSKGNLPSTLQWNFGDGTSNVTVNNPTHIFASAGTFKISLTVIDSDGDVGVMFGEIIVSEPIEEEINDEEDGSSDGISGFPIAGLTIFTGGALILISRSTGKGKKYHT